MPAPPPVLTLTLNPAIDLEMELPAWRPAEVMRASAVRRGAGGKGLNVARVLAALGVRATAACVAGGAEAAVFQGLLRGEKFEYVEITAGAGVRTNTTLVCNGKTVAKINQPGPKLTRPAWGAVKRALTRMTAGRAWVMLGGALPPGAPPDAYAQLTRLARRAGARVALDCGGAALAAALEARPDLVKPNRAELEACLGETLRGVSGLKRGMLELRRRGAQGVVVTDGARGIYGLEAEETEMIAVVAPRIEAAGVVGSGDACLAGLLFGLSRRKPWHEALRWGAACGAAKAELRDTAFPTRARVRELVGVLIAG